MWAPAFDLVPLAEALQLGEEGKRCSTREIH